MLGLRRFGPKVQGGDLGLALPGSVHAKHPPVGVLNRFIIQIRGSCQDNCSYSHCVKKPWKSYHTPDFRIWAEAGLPLRTQTGSYSSSFYLLPPTAPRPDGSTILWY